MFCRKSVALAALLALFAANLSARQFHDVEREFPAPAFAVAS